MPQSFLFACVQDDLTQMRKTLGDTVAYFEHDRVAAVDALQAMHLESNATVQDMTLPWG